MPASWKRNSTCHAPVSSIVAVVTAWSPTKTVTTTPGSPLPTTVTISPWAISLGVATQIGCTGVFVAVAVDVAVSVAVDEGVEVDVGVLDGAIVAVSVAVAVGTSVAVSVTVAVGTGVSVGVFVAVPVGTGVGTTTTISVSLTTPEPSVAATLTV